MTPSRGWNSREESYVSTWKKIHVRTTAFLLLPRKMLSHLDTDVDDVIVSLLFSSVVFTSVPLSQF